MLTTRVILQHTLSGPPDYTRGCSAAAAAADRNTETKRELILTES